jgi:hypothetical protein
MWILLDYMRTVYQIMLHLNLILMEFWLWYMYSENNATEFMAVSICDTSYVQVQFLSV